MRGHSLITGSFFLAMILAASGALAWQSETHAKLAEKVCMDFGCGCVSEIREAANMPDRDFKDFINHHCYNISVGCDSSKDWICPKKNHCPALEKMNSWLAESRNDTGCRKWRDIGIASHYFFDSRVFWHKVQNEDYPGCHEPFEGKVEKKFEAGDGSNWTIGQCRTEENYENMVRYVDEFEEILENNGAPAKTADVPLLPECGWWCMVRAWLSSYF